MVFLTEKNKKRTNKLGFMNTFKMYKTHIPTGCWCVRFELKAGIICD